MSQLETPAPHYATGATYSLFGHCVSTHHFYSRTAELIDQIKDREGLTNKSLLDLLLTPDSEKRTRILSSMELSLQEYISGLEKYIRSLPWYKVYTDKELFTRREQYYAYMLSFGLVNRLYIDAFLKADYRIAVLPDWFRRIEYNENLDGLGILLRKHRFELSFIQKTRIKALLRDLSRIDGTVALLSIHGLVELISLMKQSMAEQIPIIGVPLNSSKCPRWAEKPYDISVDCIALENLLLQN